MKYSLHGEYSSIGFITLTYIYDKLDIKCVVTIKINWMKDEGKLIRDHNVHHFAIIFVIARAASD